MKMVVIGLIVAIAALMAFLFFQPECVGGAVVADENQCIEVRGFDRAFCSKAFARPDDVLIRSGTVFPNRDACQRSHTTCIEVNGSGFSGYAPKPAGYCVVRNAAGAIGRMVPVYRGP